MTTRSDLIEKAKAAKAYMASADYKRDSLKSRVSGLEEYWVVTNPTAILALCTEMDALESTLAGKDARIAELEAMLNARAHLEDEASALLKKVAELERPTTPREITDTEIRASWRAAGGNFYGPHVETASMPEAKFLPFMRAWRLPLPSDPVEQPK